ncbi:RNA polymerase sigma factor [Paenarthrobacter ureafaciens]|uniref:RNA polymerase sigma factor n=1 Tax=Paenarthrobacter ureafaciens TaxID=37931 RepID=UPI00191743B7|nr:sigma-70 family RNA polymerase sigma factor [Paenarthrobacter ureafaciens]QQQ62480.1 sigma-70 family RNA polymerase sigma factor [Paenarthrobacter ureafaciens]UOD81510.1 sigma-70 family RNA polymerase sigma factor [Paenarthrobacter ureafaciens]WNZ04164.1 sigma-70 family RNA polymerase sigma factor [Paenarthrobacter ureafaciens]
MLATKERELIALHAEHFGRIYHYIAYRINDRERAEELANDVFRIVWEKQPDEPPGIGWLIATARNVLGNEYKGRRRREQLMERLAEDARAQGSESDGDPQGHVADILSRLKDKDREILMLAYWDDLTTAELAESLGCSPSAAAVRLHRARKAFAKAAPSQLMTEREV